MRFNARRGLIAASALQVGGGGGPTTTTFDPSNTGGAATLSNGDLTVSSTPTTMNWTRSIAGHATGKFFAEYTINSLGSGGPDRSPIGIMNGSESQSTFIGNSSNSAGLWDGDTNLYINSASAGASINYTQGDVVDQAIDIGASLIWFRVGGGNWNGSGTANPATGVGGISIAAVTSGGQTIYAASGCNNATISINFGGAAYSFSPPAGFGNW